MFVPNVIGKLVETDQGCQRSLISLSAIIKASLNDTQYYYMDDYEGLNLISGGYTRQESKEELEVILWHQWKVLSHETDIPINNASIATQSELAKTLTEV